ncbi:MAG: UrcA family protein [Pseudomonadota bacterium]
MFNLIRVVALSAAISLTLAQAFGQSNFQCVGGELLGGPEGFACETDTAGNIINVQPRALVERAPTQPVAPAPQRQTHTTTIYRSGTPTTVHTPTTRSTTPRVHRSAAPTYRETHGATTRTYSTYSTRTTVTHTPTYAHTPRPSYTVTPSRTVRSAPLPVRYGPDPRRCAPTLQRLKNTRDGRRQFEVCYSDLLPLGFSGAEALYNRIETAAQRACRGQSSFSLISNDRRCRRDAVRRAVIDVDDRELDVIFAEQTGRSIPRVRVGDPVFR